MNVDSLIKGVQRANANREKRQSKQHTNTVSKPASVEPVSSEHASVLAVAPTFDLELYRIEIISKAIAHIMNNQQEGNE